MKTTDRYREVCETLGYSPEVGFVRLHSGGVVGFTVGKPDEIRELFRRVIAAGMRPSKYLKDKANH